MNTLKSASAGRRSASTCTCGSPTGRSTLKSPIRLTWRQLYRQFGADPAKAGDKFTIRNFRSDCLRELQKIQRAWPDLHYSTAKGALILSPSPPRIAPSHLRLVP